MVYFEPKEKLKIYESEIIIKKSKFISKVCYISSKEEAESIISKVKNEYSDARHVVYAYRLDNTAKFTDDKEPQGTAGKPIYSILEKENLINVLVIVIRYFGGILLGAGPLTRAYSTVANDAIKKCEFIQKIDYVEDVIVCEYNEEEKVKRRLLEEECVIKNIERLEKVKIFFLRKV